MITKKQFLEMTDEKSKQKVDIKNILQNMQQKRQMGQPVPQMPITKEINA